jgi:hypothetical protein
VARIEVRRDIVVVLEDEEAHEVEPNGHGGDYSDNLDT